MPAGKTLAANEQALASDIMSMLNYGTAASIPATADVVRDSFFWETDTKILKQEHNGTWVETARGETVIRLAQLTEKAHSSLTGITATQHHTAAILASLLTTRGDIIFRNATVPARLAKGSIGQVLTMGADDPDWANSGKIVFSTASLFNGASPTSYTNLDLSGTVGSNQAVCLIKVFNNSGDATPQTYRFRKDDDASNFDSTGTGGAGIINDQEAVYLLIVTDATGVVEWQSNNTKTTVITMEAYLI